MAEVVLVHFVLGLRPGVIAAAERMRAAGHTVYTPDYFDGEVFDNLDDGSRKEQALGYREIARRTSEAVAGPKGCRCGSTTPLGTFGWRLGRWPASARSSGGWGGLRGPRLPRIGPPVHGSGSAGYDLALSETM